MTANAVAVVLFIGCVCVAGSIPKRDEPATRQSPAPRPTFVPVPGSPGADTGRARGVAWGDIDGDGRPELYVTRGAGFRNTLYRNRNGRLEPLQDSPASVDLGDSEGATFVDFDGDGDLDLHVVSRGGGRGLLLENDGHGELRVHRDTLVAPDSMSASMACWADVDADGQLDVFILGYRSGRSRLLRGNAGRFVVMPLPREADLPGNGRACGWGDPNADGLPDLAIAVASAPNVVLLNRGGFKFDRLSLPPSPLDTAYSYGVTWEDVDQDGRQDLFFANFDATNILYRQTEAGGWEISPWGDRLASAASKGHAWGDYDLDGTLDLYLGSGTPSPTPQYNILYLRTPGGGWRIDSLGEFATHADTSAGVAWGDMDGDGDLDLFVANWGSPGSVGRLYRNTSDMSGSGWLEIRLRGRRSNPMGLGTRVSLLSGTGAARRWQHRTLSSSTGYAGQNEPIIHFGLGTGSADSIVIRWPSGQTDASGHLAARHVYRAVEGNAVLNPESR